MFCKRCGTQLPEGTYICPQCRTNNGSGDDLIRACIPNNKYALLSYYMGLFLFWIPFSGIVTILFGIKGIRYANQNPDARGKIHSWVGILFGAIQLFVSILVVAAIIIALVNQH